MRKPESSRVASVLAASAALACAAATAPAPKAAPPAAPPAPAVKAPAPKPGAEAPGLIDRALAGPMKHVKEIVFSVRVSGRDHWYANFGNYASDLPDPSRLAFKCEDGVYWAYGDGARLCRMDLRTRAVTTVLEDPKGGIRDPQVHYDAKKILFSYRRGGNHTYHLHEINLDGTGLRQLTDGPDDDVEPSYLPDGRIVFVSSRCRRFVNCWHSRVGAVYRCEADGSDVTMLSPNPEHENTPWPLPDGRIVYMRWEYIDRSQLDYHHLWTMNPDGSQQMTFFGNMNPGNSMLDAKPVDGFPLVVASFSPGHGAPEHRGRLTLVDTRLGPDSRESARTIGTRTDIRDPWAFGTNCFLVADNEGIAIMDGTGAREVLHRLSDDEAKLEPRRALHEPRPVIPRPREAVIVDRVDRTKSTGEFFLSDVHTGRNMEGVKPGEIRKLLVLEPLPKPVNFSGGMEPLTIGGSFSLARIVGTVPVEPDGSARFEAPALRPLFFVALDENDLSVKRMQSWCIVQPGEKSGCVGCHEHRTGTAQPEGIRMAMRRAPSRIEPFAGIPDVIDFPRDVQPILDRHCLKCHGPERYAAKLDLSGGHTERYCVSYQNITRRGLVADGRNRPQSNYAPRTLGSSASKLLRVATSGHQGVKLDPRDSALLRLWIESSATYPGTYAALGCGTAPLSLPYGNLRRCAECHLQNAKDRKGQPIQAWSFGHPDYLCNLDKPVDSILLRAPLAKAAGGLGLCKDKGFASADDADYKAILTAIRKAGEGLQQVKRFDMPGFRPNRHYVREMQRFGILPAGLRETDPVNPYATDESYWRSFWPKPTPLTAER